MSQESAEAWAQLLAEHGRVRRLRSGDTLFRRGEAAAHVFRVRSGVVRLERVAADATPVIILVARPPDLLAEAALSASAYHCDARAETHALVEALPAELLKKRLRSDPDFALQWLARLSAQVRELRSLVELRGARSARERVVRYLALFGEGAAAGDASLQTMAYHLGLRPETLYRTLSSLESAGLVQRRGRRLWLKRSPPTGARPAARSRKKSET